MSKKFLGKVIAGAALGGASLLVFSPSAALADGGYHPEGYQKDSSGRIFTKPQAAKPGDEVELVEICPEARKHVWLWSKVTGKVHLTPKDHKEDYKADKKPEASKGTWDDGSKKAEEDAEYGNKAEKDAEYGKKAEEDETAGKKAEKDAEYGNKAEKDDKAGKDAEKAGKDEKAEEPGGYPSGGEERQGNEDYKKESAYQDFLRYKEYQEYQEYRRYKAEKDEQAQAEDGALGAEPTPSATEGAQPAPSPSAGEIPAPSPSATAQPQQPTDGYQSQSPNGTGGMADDGKSIWDDWEKAEGSKHGWDDSKEAEDKHEWEKAEGSKHGWDDGKKAGYEYWASVKIPWDAKPGSYDLKGSCGEGELIILPKGWVDGGDGGAASGESDNLAAAGAGVLGVAALGGLVLMRQRRTDESPA